MSPGRSPLRYVAFISYSHADSAVAKRLHRWLEGYSLPKRLVGRESVVGAVPSRLRPIFRDREELPTSADLGEQINKALRESATLIVICSPRAAASRWVNEEILSFKRLGRSGRILCLIVDGEPNATSKAGGADIECFPPGLRFQLAADGNVSTTPAEPIAADMRPGKDGRRDAWLKLAAGIAGVGFDELKQRELQRQLRRALVVSALSAVLLVTMAILTASAVLARREAVRQQEIAAAERDRAEHNFRDARNAVDRFYRKVSQEQLLKAEGLQPLRAELLGEALDYYRSFLSQRKDDPAFALEAAIVQGNVGGILSEVGDPEEALRAAHQATAALSRLHDAAPADSAITMHLSESFGNEAVNLDRLGRTEEALAANDRAIALYEMLPEGAPERTPTERQRLLNAKGAFEAKLGRFADAARSYERSLESATLIDGELAPIGLGLEPGAEGLIVVSVQDESPAAAAGIRVGDVVTRMADIELDDIAQMADVRARMKPGKALPVDLVRTTTQITLDVIPVRLGDFVTASTKYNLGYLYLQRLRQPDRAKPWLLESVDEYRRALLRESAATPDMRQGLAFAASVLGTCAYQLGDLPLQERAMRLGTATAAENVRLNPSVPRYRTTLAVNLANLCTLLQRQGNLDESSLLCREAVEHLEVALRTGGNLPSDRFQLVQVLINLGSITASKDGPEAALPVFEAAIEAVSPLLTAGSQSLPLVLAQLHRNYASSLARSGRLEDAATAYEASHRHYDAALAEAESTPDWLLQEAASLDCWRASLLHRLSREAPALQATADFEARCTALMTTATGAAPAAKARLAAVEALIDASLHLMRSDKPAAEAALFAAEGQLAKAEAADADALASAAKMLQEARQKLSDDFQDEEPSP
jgi:tetratricopeptide (TPR) repeat protein